MSVEAGAAALARFRALAGEADPDLLEGALLVSTIVDPGEDLDAARRAVRDASERVRALGGGIDALRTVLFRELGLKGDDESYDSPSNSSVARVLARRRGMPITLSIVAIEVARGAGLELAGVGLPGHFVVGGPSLPPGVFLDAFDGGELRDAAGLESRLEQIFGAPVALGSSPPRPDATRSILARVLRNLRRSFERRDRWEDALAALDFSEALEPEDAANGRERGLLLLKMGKTEEAIALLERYAAFAGGEEAEGVEELIATLRGERPGEDGEHGPEPPRRTFTLDEARAMLPRVRQITNAAVEKFDELPEDLDSERQDVLERWAHDVRALGVEVKGLWLVDFDSGAGYYCWKYPELALDHFHGYEEGFAGRLKIT
ncbi:MAG TPA: tetratricopeptide repeat protein [Thermoanaerobaculia bacterium]|nr:tetratricopeptide repeat protein [Thermoanaerobaculia bacterium]